MTKKTESASKKTTTSKAAQHLAPARQSGERIFAQGAEVSNDTWTTGLNNNDLIIGPTGAGKTRYYIKPNLMQLNESAIVTDTKGSLVEEVGPLMCNHGYDVVCIDFTNTMASSGYNPFDFVHTDPATGKPDTQDIMRITNALVPDETHYEPFWEKEAQALLNILVGYVFECLRTEDRNLASVATLLAHCKVRDTARDSLGATEQALDDFCAQNPTSFTALKWGSFRSTIDAPRMYASILSILAEKLDPFTFEGAIKMFTASERLDFRQLGQRKTVVFLNVSDTDRSLDRLVNLLYTQAMQTLCDFADDECPGHALPVPVRLYLDDFATNCTIPDFDGLISTIRSRNIAVSVVLQSITQLETMYTHSQSMTIVNGCDHWLYLGGQDIETARMISEKAGLVLESILNMGIRDIWLFERGAKARKVKRYELQDHSLYSQLPEAQDPCV